MKLRSLARLVSPKKKPKGDSSPPVQPAESVEPPVEEKAAATPAPPVVDRGLDRVPSWLRMETWKEEGRFPTLLRKCFSVHDKKRLPMVDRISENFKGSEIKCLASLSKEFNLQEDDWETIAHYDLIARLSDAGDVEHPPYSCDYLDPEEPSSQPKVPQRGAKRMSVLPARAKEDAANKEREKQQQMKMEEWNRRREEQRAKAVKTIEKRAEERKRALSPLQREVMASEEDERTSEEIVYQPELNNPQTASMPTSPTTPSFAPTSAFYTNASFMSPIVSKPSELTPMKPDDDVVDVLGELERKYMNAVEWERMEESYLGAGDGGSKFEDDELLQEQHKRQLQQQQQQQQQLPPPPGVQGDNDAPFEPPPQSQAQPQTPQPQSPNDPYDSQLSIYNEAVKQYKASVEMEGKDIEKIEGRAEFVHSWRKEEEKKKEQREKALLRAKQQAQQAARPKAAARMKQRQHYDGNTVKLLLSTFYAYHKPEKLGMVGGVVDSWRGDKMEILKTIEEKYEVGEETWSKILKGSWVPNVETKYSEQESILPNGASEGGMATRRAFEDYQIIQDTVFNAPYGNLDLNDDATLLPGDWEGRDGNFDLVLHEIMFTAPTAKTNEDWTSKLRREKVRLAYCNVVPVLMNGGKLQEEGIDGMPVQISEVDDGEVRENNDALWSASFNLPLIMNVGDDEDMTLYGYLISVHEIMEGGGREEVPIGQTYIPKADLSVYEGWKEELWLDATNPSYSRPYIRVSYCHRNRENTEGNRRRDVVKRCKVENEILLTKRAIAKAEEEKESIADLFDRMASRDKLGVGEVIGKYFEDLKKSEKDIMDKNRDVRSFQENLVVSSSRKGGGSEASTFAERQRRKSSHFADTTGSSLLPRQYADGPLDLGRLTLLCSSVFDNPGGAANYTSVVNRKDTGRRYDGKVKMEGMKRKEELMKTNLDGRKSETAPQLAPTDHTPGTPSYLKPTIQHRERVSQKEYEPDFDRDTRGRD
eukprot:CAMPEP_0118641926 /NCGR_PEP_ID=MMETSP0785-20121206/5568_1 /TAXON_ID=91992 /ORGANISM="Bolidomonas pacifica, Strain CCMP 1866" /LENGTH=987 /DNA_ID=CAMNT_0006533455 /DNA_START=193 /DNA_END=3153 /DNA_ORIENTATION=+